MLSHGLVGRLATRMPQTAASRLARLSKDTDRLHVARSFEGLLASCALRCASRRTYATTATRGRPSTAAKPKPRAAAKTTTKRSTKAGSTKAKPSAAKTKKPAKRATKKPAAKKPKVRPMTEIQKARAAKRKLYDKIKDLREQALVEPKRKLDRPLMIFTMQERQEGGPMTDAMKAGAEKYKTLSPAEIERYTHLANQAKAENEAAYKKWVESHTPEQIRLANLARAHLRRLQRKEKETPSNPHPPKNLSAAKTTKIRDDRQVKRPSSTFIKYVTDRLASGDYKHLKSNEAFKLISDEYKDISAGQKKTYEDQVAQEKLRYAREFKSVYGHTPGP